MPKLVTERIGNATVTSLTWSTTISRDVSAFHARPSQLTLKVQRTVPDGGTPTLLSEGTLSDFDFRIIPGTPLVDLHFNSVTFRAQTGRKTDVSVELGPKQFVGQLAFVQQVADAIPLDGFIDPPAVDVSPQGVRVGYSLAVPTIGLGYVTLQNLSLGAAFILPLVDGHTSLVFSFSER